MYNSSTSCFLLVPGTYWDMLLIILCKCILSVYTLLKVVSYYDLGDGFQKKLVLILIPNLECDGIVVDVKETGCGSFLLHKMCMTKLMTGIIIIIKYFVQLGV